MSTTRLIIVCAVVVLTWISFAQHATAQPQDIAYVRVDGDNGSANGDGTGWGEDACKYLQDGLAKAAWWVGPGGYDLAEVWVAATDEGPYRPDLGASQQQGDRHASFQLVDKVELYGGFAGDETEQSQRNIFMNKTVLSGDLDGDDGPDFGNREDNSYHVVTSYSNGSNAQIDGFIITGGNSDNQGSGAPSPVGGGMYASESAAAVINCTFTSNSAGWLHTEWPFDSIPGWGGALCVSSLGSLSFKVINCTFSGNRARVGGQGGAIYTSTDLSVVNGLFEGNEAEAYIWEHDDNFYRWTSYGGAIYNMQKAATCINCTFVLNTAYLCHEEFEISGRGGAIYSTGGLEPGSAQLTVTNCILWGNVAEIGTQIEVASGDDYVTYSDVEGG